MQINERMKIPRQGMPQQEPEQRVKNFNEVPFGYDEARALLEAQRCLQCKKPLCVAGCPVEINIPAFIQLIAEKKYAEAARKIKETNSLPAICGRVCPQEEQCEQVCVLARKGAPVAIGRLERFVADYEREHNLVTVPRVPAWNGKKVAVVGSGPAGLTVASDLTLMGYKVTVFEALHNPGGVLVYGIPEFRLPKDIVKQEVEYMEKLGIEFRMNIIIGKTLTIDELMNEMGYGAVFIGAGAGLPKFMNIPGENLIGVYSSNEFLTRINLMKAFKFPEYPTPFPLGKRIAVVGAGNVAMDSARCARRLPTDHVTLIYRRSRQEMPARKEEIDHGEEEGIEFKLLTNPVRIIGDERGWVKEIEVVRMELGEPDASGRRRPVTVKGSEYRIPVDSVVMAIGNEPNPLLQKTASGIEFNEWGLIKVNEETGMTSRPGVFAGGDIVTGAATVILAMGAGKRAARGIHTYLSPM